MKTFIKTVLFLIFGLPLIGILLMMLTFVMGSIAVAISS